MTDEQKALKLATFPIFNKVSNSELVQMASLFEEKRVARQTIFMKEGSDSDELYCILSGLVRIYLLHENGKEITVALRMSGEIIGEMAVLNNKPRSASAEAIQDLHVLFIRKEKLLFLIDTYPSIGFYILTILSDRLREAINSQKRTTFEALEARTYHILTVLSKHFSSREVPLSHDQLSVLVNATQPRVTEALNILQREHKLCLFRKKILLA